MGVLAPTDLHNPSIFSLYIWLICSVAPMVEVLVFLTEGACSILAGSYDRIFLPSSFYFLSIIFCPPYIQILAPSLSNTLVSHRNKHKGQFVQYMNFIFRDCGGTSGLYAVYVSHLFDSYHNCNTLVPHQNMCFCTMWSALIPHDLLMVYGGFVNCPSRLYLGSGLWTYVRPKFRTDPVFSLGFVIRSSLKCHVAWLFSIS